METYDWVNLALGIILVSAVIALCIYAMKHPLGDENYEQNLAEATDDQNRRETLHRYWDERNIRVRYGYSLNQFIATDEAEQWDWDEDKPKNLDGFNEKEEVDCRSLENLSSKLS